MIKILIITDDIEAWIQKISDIFQGKFLARFTKDEKIIYNDLFYITIINNLIQNKRGYCFSCCILDKKINSEIEYEFLRPVIKNSIIKTNNYWR